MTKSAIIIIFYLTPILLLSQNIRIDKIEIGTCECHNDMPLNTDSLIDAYLNYNSSTRLTADQYFNNGIRSKNLMDLFELNDAPLDMTSSMDSEIYRIQQKYPSKWLMDISLSDSVVHIKFKFRNVENGNWDKAGVQTINMELNEMCRLDFKMITELEPWTDDLENEMSKSKFTPEEAQLRLRLDASQASSSHKDVYFLERIKGGKYSFEGDWNPKDSKMLDTWISFANEIIVQIPETNCKISRKKCFKKGK